MHTPTILLAGVAVLSAFASAAEEPRRPRFYFPREVKRQIFTNSSSAASSTLVETTPSTLSTSTTKRFSLSDIFESLTGTSNTNAPTLSSPADTIVSTTTLTTVEPFPLPTTPTSESTGGVPSTILFPTSTPQEPTESNTRSSTTSSTSGGIIVPGPGGTLTSTAESTTSFASSAAPPPPPEEDTPTSSSGGVTFTGPGASTAPGSTEPTSATSAPEPSTSEEPSTAVTSVEPTKLTSAEPTIEEPSATSAPSSSPSDEPTTTPEASTPTSAATSVVEPTATSEPATSAPATTEPATTEPATSEPATSQPTVVPSSSGILDITSILEPITSVLSSILEPTSIADGTGSNTVVPPTSTPEPETTPTPSIPLESVISSILSTLVPTEVIPPIATEEPTTTEAPTSVIPVVTPTDIIIEPPVTNGTDPTGPPPTATPSETTPIVTTPIETTPIETGPVETFTPTNTGVVTPTETPPPPPVTTDVPSGNDTETIITPTPPPVVTPTPLPGGNETSIVDPPVTSVPSPTASNILTESISTPTDSGVVIPTGSVTQPTTPTITQQPTAAPNGTEPAPSATPITTVPGTTLDWGTSLIVAPTMTSQESGATASTEPTGIPSTLPKVVGNPNEQVDKSAPPGMTEVQLGFQYPLNFRFVVANAMSSAQIFAYLPEGLADGLNVTRDQVTIKNLAPLDTTAQLGFITTMARAYIPESSFRKLQASIHLPNTAIYVNNDQRVETLMNYINPAIPLQPGGSLGGSSDSGPGGPGNDEDKGKDEDPFNGQQATSSGKVNGTTAGFVVAGVGGAVAYGAAMFLIARRYKKRRQSHRRSQSLTNPSEMMQSGSPSYMGGAGAFMSGGRISPGGTNDRNSRGSGRTGNSARTAQISAPMMAENSLGWN